MHARMVNARRSVAALLLIGFGSTATARASDWTATDTAFELGLVALSVTDVAQTRWFLSRQPYAVETNPFLGRHPASGKLLGLSAAAVASHGTVALLLPKPYRRLWQILGIGAEMYAVTSNARTFGFHVMF